MVLVGSLLGGTDLNYIAHKGCICRASADRRNQQEVEEKAVFLIQKELADEAGLNCLQQEMENGAWLTAIPHHLNGTELSWEEFQENILLRYSIVPLKLPTEFDACDKKFLPQPSQSVGRCKDKMTYRIIILSCNSSLDNSVPLR